MSYFQKSPQLTIVVFALMLTAVLFIIPRKEYQFSSPSADQWIMKTGYMHKMEYNSVIWKNEMFSIMDLLRMDNFRWGHTISKIKTKMKKD